MATDNEWLKPEDALEVIGPGQICVASYPSMYFATPVLAVRNIKLDIFEPYPYNARSVDWSEIQPDYVLPVPPIPIPSVSDGNTGEE